MFDQPTSPKPSSEQPDPSAKGSETDAEQKLKGLTPSVPSSSGAPSSAPRLNVIDQHIQATAAAAPLSEGLVEDESAHRRNILIIASVLIVLLFVLILGGFAVNLLFPSSSSDLLPGLINADLGNTANISFNKNANAAPSNSNTNTANINAVTNTAPPVNPASDADADGLTYAQELLMGTDANDPDTDNDSYLDGAELQNGYNPLGEGVVLDHDGDGVDDAKEVFAGTDPYDARE